MISHALDRKFELPLTAGKALGEISCCPLQTYLPFALFTHLAAVTLPFFLFPKHSLLLQLRAFTIVCSTWNSLPWDLLITDFLSFKPLLKYCASTKNIPDHSIKAYLPAHFFITLFYSHHWPYPTEMILFTVVVTHHLSFLLKCYCSEGWDLYFSAQNSDWYIEPSPKYYLDE